MSNNCLICGFEQSGKTTLLKNLASNSKINNSSNITRNDDIRYYEWMIQNKYYNSNISFTIINNLEAINKLDLQSFQALVLVVNLNETKKTIFNNIDDWFSVLEPYSSSIECCLLMANYSTLYNEKCDIQHSQEYEEFHNTLNSWCVDKSFELILSPFIVSNNNNVTNEIENENKNENKLCFHFESSMFKNYDASELGSQRIDGALQCVAWPLMTRNNNVQSNNKNVKSNNNNNTQQALSSFGSKHGFISEEKISTIDTTESKNDENDDNNVTVNEKSQKDDENKNENKPKNKKVEKESSYDNDENISDEDNNNNSNKEKEQKELISNLLWQQVTQKNEKQKNNNANDHNIDDDDNDNDNDDEDKNMQQLLQFQSLIEEMQNVRSQAKSGNLTNEERREKASRTALRLMKFMGIEDDNDELFEEID